MTAINGRVIKE